MVGTAAHFVDHVLTPLPLRQWVLAVPKRLRYFLYDNAALQGVIVRILLRAIERCLRVHSLGSSAAACSISMLVTRWAAGRKAASRWMPRCTL